MKTGTDSISRTLFVQYQIVRDELLLEFESLALLAEMTNNRTNEAAYKSEIEYAETFNLSMAE